MASARILVVEDDTCLQTFLIRALQRLDANLSVEWADTAETALALISRSREPGARGFDLILSDILLPGAFSGLQLWRDCERICPETPYMLMSGMDVGFFLKAIGPNDIAPPYLPKPFTLAELQGAVANALAREHGRPVARAARAS